MNSTEESEKDANRRLHDIADARIEIEDALATPENPELTVAPTVYAPPRRRHVTRLGVAFLAGAAVIGLAVWALKILPPPTSHLVSRFVVALPPDTPLNLDPPSLAISPDGTHL